MGAHARAARAAARARARSRTARAAPAASDELFAVALLVDEMKSEDNEVRVAAMKRLRTIARALGAARTRAELMPFLGEQTEDDDEVLLAMASELGGFVELVGGPSHATILVEPLGALAVRFLLLYWRAVRARRARARRVPRCCAARARGGGVGRA